LWVGGTLIVALGSAAQPLRSPSPLLRETLGAGVAVFILTGTILAFQRLSSAPLPVAYPVVLAVKVGLGVWMFTLVRRPRAGSSISPWLPAAVGVAIYALAIVLRMLYESALRP
jgi:hypothetical protein